MFNIKYGDNKSGFEFWHSSYQNPVLSSTTTIEHMNKLWTTQHKIKHNGRVKHKIYVRIMNIQEEVGNMNIEIILMKAALHIWIEVNQS